MADETLQAATAEAPQISLEDAKLLSKKYLKKKDYVLFSLAQFASSAVTGLVQGYLLFFYTVCIGISPTAVGTMFLISKIFDGLNDPIMGVIVDKTRTRWGKMRPYLIFGAIPWGIITIALFIPGVKEWASGAKIAYMYITYLLYSVAGTVIGVPLQGIPAVASPNTDERSKIISISRILGSIGEQSALVLLTLFLLLTNDNYTSSYLLMAVVIGTLGPLFMLLGGASIKERLEPTQERPKVLDGFKFMFKNKPFLMLILSNLLTFFRNFVSAMIIYVVTYIFGNGKLQIVFAIPSAIASLLGMMLAPKLKRLMDSKKLFILSTVAHSVGLALVWLVYILGGTNWILVAALMFIAMVPVGILNVIPHLMATDTLDFWEDKTGQRCEGMTFALMSLRSKVSSGFKDFTLSLFLTFFLFSQPLSFLGNHTPEQSEFTKTGLFLMFTLIPAVLNLISIVPMLFYSLNGKRCAEIQARLLHKRAADANLLDRREREKNGETFDEPDDGAAIPIADTTALTSQNSDGGLNISTSEEEGR